MKPALVVLAAGMGSRYGGQKQTDGIGPNGEWILEYSIFDALKKGFGKVVFITREKDKANFERAVRQRIGNTTDLYFVAQELNTGLEEIQIPSDRQKPWGTGHAVMVAAGVVAEPFGVINADDLYGADAYKKLADFLIQSKSESEMAQYAMVGYPLRNTLSEHGHVSRGVCQKSIDGFLQKIEEVTAIEKIAVGAQQRKSDGGLRHFSGDELVSLNLWGFTPTIFPYLQTAFSQFFAESGSDLKAEFFLPTVVDDLVQKGEVQVTMLETTSSWYGMTYREDREIVSARITQLITQGEYPQHLWNT
jgi:UTP-glucose-1-phosphate uridylyltransferase